MDATQINPTMTPAVDQPNLSPEEIAQRGYHIQLLTQAAMLRESSLPQFDGMSYSMWNQTNEMADMSYLPPKKNKGESRLVTGVTHEKDTTILSMLLNFNFEVKVHAFDQNNEELLDLGESLTAMVRKSRELENYDEKRPIFYRNLLVQGTAFTRERYVEIYKPKKILQGEVDFTDLDKMKWIDAGFEKEYDGCVSELVDGKKVFLQNIRVQDMRQQPRVFTVEYLPRQNAEAMYGEMARWKNVPYTINPTPASYLTLGSIYSDWVFAEIDYNKVEVFEVFEPFDNTYQLYLNGVPMLPVGFPLVAISPSGLVPIAKGDLDPMNLFAYSKSIPSKTKIDQATLDEVVKIMVLKLQQSARPPVGNIGDKILSENVFMPGRINPDVSKDDIQILLPSPGVTQSDFSFYQLIQEQISQKSVSQGAEGLQQKGSITATEYLDLQKKQMLKLGGSIDAVISWEKQMAHLRTINLIANWTKEIQPNIADVREKLKNYRNISVQDTFADGQDGLRMIKFQPGHSMDRDTVYEEEEEYRKRTGQDVRISYIDPDWLRSLRLNFYYEIIPTDKNNDKLTQMMFVNMVTQAMQMFGPQSMNVAALKKRYAHIMGENFDTLFLEAVPSPMQAAPGTEIAPGMGLPEGIKTDLKDVMMKQ